MNYYANRSFANVYNLMEKYPYLEETDIGDSLESEFLERFKKSRGTLFRR